MQDYIWFIYVSLVILVFLPFLRVDIYLKYKRYNKFFFINLLLVVWTLMLGLRFVLTNSAYIYYASLSIYSIIFALVILLVLAIRDYLDLKTNKLFSFGLLGLWIIQTTVVATNSSHQLFIKLSYNSNITIEIFNSADIGVGFSIHTIVSYGLLAYVFILLSRYFLNEYRKNKDWIPLFIVTVCFIFGISVNMIHLFLFEFTIDPTLSVFVIFMLALYMIFIIRDLNLISQLNNNAFILNHYREMYLIVDVNGKVVNASDELRETFKIHDFKNITYQEITKIMNEKAIIYSDTNPLDIPFDKNKTYLHMKEEKINLPLFKYSGKLFLYYDETEHQKLMHELNYVLYHDLMTKLYNRNYFEDYKKTLDKKGDIFCVIIFDLDGLKRTNDHFGHKAGDDLLKCFSNSLKELSNHHKKSTPIRLGGDEFVLIIESPRDCQVDQIINKLNENILKRNQGIPIGYSYGTATRTDKHQKISNVLKDADEVLYEMKKQRYEEKV
jgi:diguanylate cyclase (GGDEF)-like protein